MVKGSGWTVESNLLKFNRALSSYSREAELEHGKLIRWASLEVVRRISRKSPVDTGRSRAAWLPFLIANGMRAPLRGDDQKAIREGLRAGKYSFKWTGIKPYAWIQNNVNYTVYLEYGVRKGAQKRVSIKSAKLSAVAKSGTVGFVRKSIAEVSEAVKRKLSKRGK